ncbi:hypothetical protein LCGC14_0909730 [marine sediment metagenome]|uniref:LamG-like jellyroll fold domain-containing protein n=1 Tax=marine sediment metagenome TaxID=412755 RepID=A0A0F9NU03_9ZZZZ
MQTTISDGRSIDRYIPPQLRNTFYKNTNRRYMRNDGLDPYSFSTKGLVLYLPLWALNNGGTNSIQSVDAYKHSCSVTGALWQPDGRLLDKNDDWITVPNHSALPKAGDLTHLLWYKPTSVFSSYNLLDCSSTNVDGWVLQGQNVDSGNLAYGNYRSGAGDFLDTAGTNGLTAGSWGFIAITYEVSITTGKIYIDKVIGDTEVAMTAAVTNSRDIRMGASLVTGAQDSDGILGEYWLYNRVLSVAEMEHTYNVTAWRYQ